MLLKEDFVSELAKKGYTKKAANYVVDDVFDTLTECLARGDSVLVRGFGKFEVKRRAARKTINPRDGKETFVEEHNGVQFTNGSALRRAINQSDVL